ncbi:MAG: aldo/keto reductase [Betaproteobacteria bacterium]
MKPALRSTMPTRILGRSGVEVSAIGFGAGPLGGFYGPVAADAGAAAAHRAFELGVRYFDVAPLYGHGRAELALGHALRDIDRDAFVLSTKVGRYTVPAGASGQPSRLRDAGVPFNPVRDYSREGALRSLEQSLLRLGVARIDLVYVHDVDAHSQGTDEAAEQAFRAAMAGALPALLELKAQGVIRAVGVGINQPHWALRWLAEAEFDALMLAGRLTLLNRDAELGVLAACRAHGVAYVAAGAFNGGLLARGEDGDGRYNYRPTPVEVRDRYAALATLAREHAVELKAAALQFPLRCGDVASLVVGASTAQEVEENIRLLESPVPESFWAALA